MIKFLLIFTAVILSSVVSRSASPTGVFELEDRAKYIPPPKGCCIGKCTNSEPFKRLPHENCRKYCICMGEYFVIKECNNDYHFSVANNECVNPSLSECVTKYPDCIGKCPNKLPPNAIVILAHDDCRKFCRCKLGEIDLVECPQNELFDDDSATCRPQETASCSRLNSYEPTSPSNDVTTPTSDPTPAAPPATPPAAPTVAPPAAAPPAKPPKPKL